MDQPTVDSTDPSEGAAKRRRLDETEISKDSNDSDGKDSNDSVGQLFSRDVAYDEPTTDLLPSQSADEDPQGNVDVTSEDDEEWNLDRLMRTFDSAEDMKKYIERTQDIQLLRFLAKLQGGRMERFSARKKLTHVNDINDVRNLLQRCQKILILTGAGVSVSAGIPDFRSANGIYARLKSEYDMPSPTCMFDKTYFNQNPGPFFDFARELWPGRFEPTPSHLFIAELEKQGKLLRNYTQNIDTLEQRAGITRVIACHGSFATATCVTCRRKVDGASLEDDIMAKRVARCSSCAMCDSDGSPAFGVMKPDIVFFGEALPDLFYASLEEDLPQADLMLVIGTSLRVAPVSEILPQLPRHVPVVLINREVVGYPHDFDVELLGDSDAVLAHLSALAHNVPTDTMAKDDASEHSTPHAPTPQTSENLEEAAQIIQAGGIVKWAGRPSTFLFQGFLPPPTSRASSPTPSDRSDISDDDQMSRESGVGLEEEPAVDGSDAEDEVNAGSLDNVHIYETVNDPSVASASAGAALTDSDDADLDLSSQAVRQPAKPLPGTSGYDESWGIQRPRSKASLIHR